MKSLGVLKKISRYFVAPMSVFLVFLFVAMRGDLYPFGSKSISWCDMNQQVIPILCNLKDIFNGKSSFFISYENAGGMNFYGVYMFYVSSPLNLLVAFVEKENMSLFVNVLVMLKMILAGGLAFVFFEYKFGEKNFLLSLAFSVLYSFSGYVLMYFQILSWLDCVYLFPVIMLGLEKMKEGKSFALYTAALSLNLWCSFYISYMVVMFLLLYAGVSALMEKDKKFAYRFVIGSFVAMLISAVVYIPVTIQYLASARTGSVIDNLKSSNLITSYTTVLPTVFCLSIVLPFFFARKRSQLSSVYVVLLILTAIPLILEPVNKMWHTGNYMAFPSRYAFITIFLGLIVAGENISRCGQESEEKSVSAGRRDIVLSCVLGGVAVIACCFVVLWQNNYFENHSHILTRYVKSLWGNADSFNGLLTVYVVVLLFAVAIRILYSFGLLRKTFVCVVLLIAVFGECSFSSRVYMESASHDDISYRERFTIADKIDDDEFYRVGLKTKATDVNAIGALGYNSLGHYTSLTNGAYMNMMKSLGYSSYWMEVGQYGGTAFTDALLCQKYVAGSGSSSTALYSAANWHISRNEYSLPLGIVVPESVLTAGFSGERAEIVQSVFKAVGGKEDLLEIYPFEETVVSGMTAVKTDGVYRFSDLSSRGKILYTVQVTGKQRLYFDCFDLYTTALKQHINDSFSVRVNGLTVTSSYPTQSRNGFLYLGTFENRTVTVEITVLKEFYGASFSVFGEKDEVLKSFVNEAIAAHCKVNGNKIEGKIAAETNEYLLLSVPYDKGYKAKVNGKKVETKRVLGDMIAVPVSEGENAVSLSFVPQGFAAGIAISVIGLILWIVFLAFGKKIMYNMNTEYNKGEVGLREKMPRICQDLCYGAGAFAFLLLYVFPLAVFLFSAF